MNFSRAAAIVFGTFHECHSADIHQFVMKTDGVRGGNSANAPGVPIDLETSASAQRLAFPAAPRPAPAAPIENEEAIQVSAQESDGLVRHTNSTCLLINHLFRAHASGHRHPCCLRSYTHRERRCARGGTTRQQRPRRYTHQERRCARGGTKRQRCHRRVGVSGRSALTHIIHYLPFLQ